MLLAAARSTETESGTNRCLYISRGHFTRKAVRITIKTGVFADYTRKVTRKVP
jgi:hypothetical protein